MCSLWKRFLIQCGWYDITKLNDIESIHYLRLIKSSSFHRIVSKIEVNAPNCSVKETVTALKSLIQLVKDNKNINYSFVREYIFLEQRYLIEFIPDLKDYHLFLDHVNDILTIKEMIKGIKKEQYYQRTLNVYLDTLLKINRIIFNMEYA